MKVEHYCLRNAFWGFCEILFLMTVAPYNTRETEFDFSFALKILLWSQSFLSSFFALAQEVQCNGCRVFFLLFWERKLENKETVGPG